MIIQISSGQGPTECELAVSKLYEALKKEYPNIELIYVHKSRISGGSTLIQFSTERDLSELEGSVQWICRSPFRPNHKRKNWFVDVRIIPETEFVIREQEVRIERFYSSGKGGQNVNKVETGVRLVHMPTGIAVISTEERSEYANKRNAMRKLNAILEQKEKAESEKQVHSAWREYNWIQRGNPVRAYVGMEFRRKR